MFRSLLFLAILHTCAGTKKTLPVFVLDYDNVMSHLTLDANPFNTLTKHEFTELIRDASKRADCVIIFAEETLCTEDFNLEDNHGNAFYHLQHGVQDRKVLYLPSVLEPYDALKAHFEPQETNVFHLGSGDKLILADQYKYLYIYFQDSLNMSRLPMFRKHDVIMKEVYFTMRQLKPGPVVAFYTGMINPIRIEQVKHVPLKTKPEVRLQRGVMIVTPDALFRLNGVFASKHKLRSFDQTPAVDYEFRTRRSLTTNMQYADFHLQFNFQLGQKEWKLSNVVLLEAGEEVGRTFMDITAPWERSYYCAEPITIINLRDGSSITVSEYQIEPLSDSRRFSGPVAPSMMSDDGSKMSPSLPPGKCSFSRPIRCGPYFNIVILSSLLIFFLFLAIAMWGVTVLFNCGYHNKFDDMNQKPLVIAQEAG